MDHASGRPSYYTPPTLRECIHLLSYGTLATLSGCGHGPTLDAIYCNWITWLDAQPDVTIWGLDWGACFAAFRTANPAASGADPAATTP